MGLLNIFDYVLILFVFLCMVMGIWRGFGIIGGVIGIGLGLFIAGLLVFFFSHQPRIKQKLWFQTSHLSPYIQRAGEWVVDR